MAQRWHTAVAAAGEQPPADLPAAVAEELIAVSSDLAEAMRRAAVLSWSVECDGLVVQVVMLSRLTAATPRKWIPAPPVANGVYQGFLQSASLSYSAPCLPQINSVPRMPVAGSAVAARSGK